MVDKTQQDSVDTLPETNMATESLPPTEAVPVVADTKAITTTTTTTSSSPTLVDVNPLVDTNKPLINDGKSLVYTIHNIQLTNFIIIIEEAMFKTTLPESNELETESVGSFHWHINNWKTLETKTHSPVFEVNGFPWYVFFFFFFFLWIYK